MCRSEDYDFRLMDIADALNLGMAADSNSVTISTLGGQHTEPNNEAMLKWIRTILEEYLTDPYSPQDLAGIPTIH